MIEENFLVNLKNAFNSLKVADHLIYVTFPLLKEKRLLLKALEELNTSLIVTMNAILQYEYLYKRINLTKDPKMNFEIFRQKCASRFNITENQLNKIIELLKLVENHKKSGMEFMKKDKIIILFNNLKTETLTSEKIKDFLNLTKDIIKKAEERIKRKI